MANARRKARISYVESRLKEKGIKSTRPGSKRNAGEKRARAQFRAEFRAKGAQQRGSMTSNKPSNVYGGSKEALSSLYGSKQGRRVTSNKPSKKTSGFPARGRVRDAAPYRPARGKGRGGKGYR